MNTRIIKVRIAELGLTNKEVAEKVGIHKQTLTNWIGNRDIERVEKFMELLKFLDIDINDIM